MSVVMSTVLVLYHFFNQNKNMRFYICYIFSFPCDLNSFIAISFTKECGIRSGVESPVRLGKDFGEIASQQSATVQVSLGRSGQCYLIL